MGHRRIRGALLAFSIGATGTMGVVSAEAFDVPACDLEAIEDSGDPNDNVVSFLDTAVGNWTGTSVELHNAGATEFTVRSWTVLYVEVFQDGTWRPSDATGFRVDPPNPAGARGDVVLTPGESVELELTFGPTQPRPYRAEIEIEYADGPGDGCFHWVGLAGDGIPSCDEDLDVSGAVDFEDVLLLIAHWHEFCPGSGCTADCNGDGYVDFDDFTCVLSAWGPCSSDG